MGDVAILWNADPNYQSFDFAQAPNGDIADTNYAGTSDLETSVVISLFTDRVVPPDWVFSQKGILNDPKGFWADSDGDMPLLGSLLWLLRFQSGAPNLLQIAKNYTEEALQWLIDYKVAATIAVTTSYIFPNSTRAIGISVVITEPVTNKTSRFAYSYAWKSITNYQTLTSNVVTNNTTVDLIWDSSSWDVAKWS